MYEKIVHFDVKEGKSNKSKKWILENQKDYAEALPSGWKYIDCYYAISHMGSHEWQIRHEIENLAAYDTLKEYDDGRFNRLLAKIYDYINPNIPMEIEAIGKVETLKILGEGE